jgi:hypothetical protein
MLVRGSSIAITRLCNAAQHFIWHVSPRLLGSRRNDIHQQRLKRKNRPGG